MDALLQQSELLMEAGKYQDAEANVNQALHFLSLVLPRCDYVKRAQLHRKHGQVGLYRQELSETLRLDPYILAARLEMARVLDGSEPRGAIALLNETPPSQKDAPRVIIERNWALWAGGDLPEMRKGIDRGLSRGESLDLLVQDGLWRLRSGDPSGARASLEKVLKVNPTDLRALGALRVSYAIQKQDSSAVQKVKEYAAQQSTSAPVQDYLGFLLLGQQDRSGARAAFMAAKKADPHYTPADLSLAQLDVADHRLGDAVQRLTSGGGRGGGAGGAGGGGRAGGGGGGGGGGAGGRERERRARAGGVLPVIGKI